MDTSKLKILSLIFPVIACILMTLYHTQNQNKGELFRIPVTGYDPRDLLRGHYLTYRYDWDWQHENARVKTQKTAACLKKIDGNTRVKLMHAKAAQKTCDAYIIGRGATPSNFRIGYKSGNATDLTKYYIPEANARQLDKMLRNRDENAHQFEIALRVNRAGKAFIAGMYIDDIRLEEWIKNNAE